MRKNFVHNLFDQTLQASTDYTLETVIGMIQVIARHGSTDERVPTIFDHEDTIDVLRTALNTSRVRSYTGKRGARSISKANQILLRYATSQAHEKTDHRENRFSGDPVHVS